MKGLVTILGVRGKLVVEQNVHMHTRTHAVFPTVTAPQTELIFELGTKDGVLMCSGSGDPQPDIQWLRLPDMFLLPSPGFPNYVSFLSHNIRHLSKFPGLIFFYLIDNEYFDMSHYDVTCVL